MLDLLNPVVAMLQVEALDLATVLLQKSGEEAQQGNVPGGPGWAPWRLIAGALLIITIVSGAYLFTYWISKDE
ncbi:MAG TPA: hypothetical protein VEY13_09660 [Rubrobacteraceae bacterium]|jgi:hypothetical protein|nr:hypothetical protein [Rubrobacteraceae bacterium]